MPLELPTIPTSCGFDPGAAFIARRSTLPLEAGAIGSPMTLIDTKGLLVPVSRPATTRVWGASAEIDIL